MDLWGTNLSRGWENAQEGGLRINQGASTHVVRDPVTKANRLALFAPPSLPFSNKTGWAEWGTDSKEGKGEGVPFNPISSVHFRCTGFVSLSPHYFLPAPHLTLLVTLPSPSLSPCLRHNPSKPSSRPDQQQEPGQRSERETPLLGNTRTYKYAWTLVFFLIFEMRLSAYIIFQILFRV